MLVKKQIISSFSDLKEKPKMESNLESQCLFGEKVLVLKKKLGWSYVECQLDNYKGWIKNETLGRAFDNNFILNSLNSIVYEVPNLKSKSVFNLFMGSKVNIIEHDDNWFKIKLNSKKFGFISKSNNFLQLNSKNINWIDNIRCFKNSPYLLGGKTCMGIDCSGLVQVILESLNIFVPRNTNDQIDFLSKNFIDTNKIEKGCLLYWKGHVAIALSNKTLIHSNAFHMKVNEEEIDNVNQRIKRQYGPLLKVKKIKF